jgi:hypothetical protein
VKETTFIEGTIVKSRRSQKGQAGSMSSTVETESAGHQLHPPASLGVNEFEAYICYTRKHFLVDGVVGVALRDVRLSDIVTSRTTISSNQVFLQAVLSFAVIVFGTQHGQAHVTSQGYTMYGAALEQLNRELLTSNCYNHDEVILSVVTLALLESWVPTGPKHYLKHMIGLQRLLELRGPTIQSPKSLQLYRGLRHIILFASLRSGNPSILARPEWKTVLRINCSIEEMQEQDLFDVLADCTVLIAERDSMLENWNLDPEKSATQRDEINRKAEELLTLLHAWRTSWANNISNSHSETTFAEFTTSQPHQFDGLDSPPFVTIFEFSNESAAITLMFYNTVLINVLRVLAPLGREILIQNTLQEGEDLNDLREGTKEGYSAAERLAALEVCRCIPYYLVQRDSGHPPAFPLAVTTVWTTLQGNESAEGRWITEIMKTKGRELIAKGIWPS